MCALAESEMNVVGHAPGAKAFASRVASDRGEVGMKGGADGASEDGGAVFCAEDKVDNDEGERLRHGRKYSARGWLGWIGPSALGFSGARIPGAFHPSQQAGRGPRSA